MQPMSDFLADGRRIREQALVGEYKTREKLNS